MQEQEDVDHFKEIAFSGYSRVATQTESWQLSQYEQNMYLFKLILEWNPRMVRGREHKLLLLDENLLAFNNFRKGEIRIIGCSPW